MSGESLTSMQGPWSHACFPTLSLESGHCSMHNTHICGDGWLYAAIDFIPWRTGLCDLTRDRPKGPPSFALVGMEGTQIGKC